jgi:3-hydroxybutyryl-CoA dehydrogenase
MSINTVGVVGAGIMGSGIAQVAATKGLNVVLVDVSDRTLKRASRTSAVGSLGSQARAR